MLAPMASWYWLLFELAATLHRIPRSTETQLFITVAAILGTIHFISFPTNVYFFIILPHNSVLLLASSLSLTYSPTTEYVFEIIYCRAARSHHCHAHGGGEEGTFCLDQPNKGLSEGRLTAPMPSPQWLKVIWANGLPGWALPYPGPPSYEALKSWPASLWGPQDSSAAAILLLRQSYITINVLMPILDWIWIGFEATVEMKHVKVSAYQQYCPRIINDTCANKS